jgi:mRNA interferase RelE/StbE
MTWRIEYRPDVIEHDIPALPKTARLRIQKAIEQRLATEPMLYGKPLRFNLSGLRRIRVGDYRVIYCLNQGTKAVVITAIDHRKDVYE